MNKIFIISAIILSATFAVAQSAPITVEGNQIKDGKASKKPAPQPAVAQAGTGSAAEAGAQPMPSEEVATLDAIQSEMDAALPESTAVTRVKPVKKKSDNDMYIMGVAGTSGYPEVGNVNGEYAVSGALGMLMDEWMLEAGVGMAKYNMSTRNFNSFNSRDGYDVEHYNFQVGAKYRLMDGKFVPNVGALASYSNRTFTLSNPAVNTFTGNQNPSADSQTIDAGISAGVDYQFGQDYAIGFDLKYMFNVSNSAGNSSNNTANISTPGYVGTPIEALQYYTAGLSGRMNF